MNLFGIARKAKDYKLLSFSLDLGQAGLKEAQKQNEVYRQAEDIAYSVLEVNVLRENHLISDKI